MTKGDLVIEKLAAAATFQPASGVEVIIRSMSNGASNGVGQWKMWDGAGAGYVGNSAAASPTLSSEISCWVGINNTIYIVNDGQEPATFTGVQVK